MNRITRRIPGTDIIEFVDGKGYGNLSQEESIRLLLKTLADCEDKLEKFRDVKLAYFKLEDWLYSEGKDKPIDIQAAILWGGLSVAYHHGAYDWNEIRNLFGEFMSKKMNLR